MREFKIGQLYRILFDKFDVQSWNIVRNDGEIFCICTKKVGDSRYFLVVGSSDPAYYTSKTFIRRDIVAISEADVPRYDVTNIASKSIFIEVDDGNS